jgi:hypothetical protein
MTYGRRLSQDTVRRRLAEVDLRPYQAAKGTLLTREHRRERLRFTQEHLNYNNADWGRVMFSDESRFSLYSDDDRRRRVYRRPGERYSQTRIVGTVQYGGGSVMVWPGITSQAKTELVHINGGRLTVHRYITEVLERRVVPFAPYIGDNFIYMQDNAKPHIAGVVDEYFDQVRMN